MRTFKASMTAGFLCILTSWQIWIFFAMLSHERNHPALALLLLGPLNYTFFWFTKTLFYPTVVEEPLDPQKLWNWLELTGFKPVSAFSLRWFLRCGLLVVSCATATIGILIWYGSFKQVNDDIDQWKGSTQGLLHLGALVALSFFFYAPLRFVVRKFALSSGLLEEGPWRALLASMGVWLWVDALFAALHQQVDLLCKVSTGAVCGGMQAYSQSINSFPQALYFSTMTLATVGFGDITPVAPIARVLVVVEVIVGIGLLGFILARAAGIASVSSRSG